MEHDPRRAGKVAVTRTKSHRRGDPAPSLASLAIVPAAFVLVALLYLVIDFRDINQMLARLCACA